MLTIFLCMPMVAQNYENNGKPYYCYCQIGISSNMSGKIRLDIIWQDKDEQSEFRDEKGVKIEFKNRIDVINYMSKRGWEVVDSHVLGNGSIIFYLLKKQVTKDEDAKQGIYFKSDFEK